jgi:hypothetical protein
MRVWQDLSLGLPAVSLDRALLATLARLLPPYRWSAPLVARDAGPLASPPPGPRPDVSGHRDQRQGLDPKSSRWAIFAGQVLSTASISRRISTRSPTRTPPVSRTALKSTPKSLRLS